MSIYTELAQRVIAIRYPNSNHKILRPRTNTLSQIYILVTNHVERNENLSNLVIK